MKAMADAKRKRLRLSVERTSCALYLAPVGIAAQPSSRVSDPLTARERDVLGMISQGLSNKRIARALEISPETVKSHVKHIFLKLEDSTRTQAVFRALSFELS